MPGGHVHVQLGGVTITVPADSSPFLTVVLVDGTYTLLHADDEVDDARRNVALAAERFGRGNVEPVTLAPSIRGGYVRGIVPVPADQLFRQPPVERKRTLPADHAKRASWCRYPSLCACTACVQ